MKDEAEKLMSSARIRKVLQQGKNPKLQENIGFYTNYAAFVLRVLRKPRFQNFLKWMMKREEIDDNMVEEVRVMILPYCKENGKSLVGKWDGEGQISIYPKKAQLLRNLAKKFDARMARFYVKCRARAALIHEILHTKYRSNEDEVRRLTKKYFHIFLRNHKTENANKNVVFSILFKNQSFAADSIVNRAS